MRNERWDNLEVLLDLLIIKLSGMMQKMFEEKTKKKQTLKEERRHLKKQQFDELKKAYKDHMIIVDSKLTAMAEKIDNYSRLCNSNYQECTNEVRKQNEKLVELQGEIGNLKCRLDQLEKNRSAHPVNAVGTGTRERESVCEAYLTFSW